MRGERAGNGGGKEFERVAGELRTRMADGRYVVQSRLPSQRELAEEFGVSRDTVQRVLGELRSEGWIESRQGSRSRVIGRVLRNQRIHSPTSSTRAGPTVTLGQFISEAFEQPEVILSVYTLTSESLDAHIRLQAERIRAGEIAPERISLRMLLPSESLEFPYWRSEDGRYDQILKERALAITRRHIMSLRATLNDLRTMRLVPSTDLEIRQLRAAPLFKLYLVNETDALHGPYVPVKRSVCLDDCWEIEAVDVFGPGATLTHHRMDTDPSSQGTVFVTSMQSWFDGAWELLADHPA